MLPVTEAGDTMNAKLLGKMLIAVAQDVGIDTSSVDTAQIAALGNIARTILHSIFRSDTDFDDAVGDALLHMMSPTSKKCLAAKLAGQQFNTTRAYLLQILKHSAYRSAKKHRMSAASFSIDNSPADDGSSVPFDSTSGALEVSNAASLRSTSSTAWADNPVWAQLSQEARAACVELDRQPRSGIGRPRTAVIPAERLFDLLYVNQMSYSEAAQQLIDEGVIIGDRAALRQNVRKVADKVKRIITQEAGRLNIFELVELV